jgi:hypothetical protein
VRLCEDAVVGCRELAALASACLPKPLRSSELVDAVAGALHKGA